MAASGLRILLVEDSPVLRRLLGMGLESLGHRVEGRPNMMTALRALQDGVFDVAIVDMVLPDGTGLQFASAARGLPLSRRPHVIGTSGIDPSPEALALFDGFVTKPASEVQIAPLLDAVAPKQATSRP